MDEDKKQGKEQLLSAWAPGYPNRIYSVAGCCGAVPIIMWLTQQTSAWILISWLSLPFALPLIKDMRTKKGAPLNATLAGTARLSLIYSLLFSLGYLLGI